MNLSGPIIALDIGGTAIKSALISTDGTILKNQSLPTDAGKGLQHILNRLKESIQSVFSTEAAGIGVGVPGCVDPDTGMVQWIENIPELNECRIVEHIQNQFQLKTVVDNDANNAARGEFFFGSGKGSRNMLAITLGTGVGGGLFLNEKIHRGSTHYAGEIGHMVSVPDGAKCSCGKYGCLEAYASATAIRDRALAEKKRGLSPGLNGLSENMVDVEKVFLLAKEGDDVCKNIIFEAGRALGIGIGNVINLLNLDSVVVGGGMAAAGDALLSTVKTYAARASLPISYRNCKIVAGKLVNSAGVLGAAALLLMKDDP